tara:strand:+ start:598 stop:858 length:261 start_codon:yes stop_codon:yes gene_type:complete
MKPNFNYKGNLCLKPCDCREQCGNYILFVRREMAHVIDAPEGELIDIASLSVNDLYDLFFNINEILEIESARDDLINQFNSTKEQN